MINCSQIILQNKKLAETHLGKCVRKILDSDSVDKGNPKYLENAIIMLDRNDLLIEKVLTSLYLNTEFCKKIQELLLQDIKTILEPQYKNTFGQFPKSKQIEKFKFLQDNRDILPLLFQNFSNVYKDLQKIMFAEIGEYLIQKKDLVEKGIRHSGFLFGYTSQEKLQAVSELLATLQENLLPAASSVPKNEALKQGKLQKIVSPFLSNTTNTISILEGAIEATSNNQTLEKTIGFANIKEKKLVISNGHSDHPLFSDSCRGAIVFGVDFSRIKILLDALKNSKYKGFWLNPKDHFISILKNLGINEIYYKDLSNQFEKLGLDKLLYQVFNIFLLSKTSPEQFIQLQYGYSQILCGPAKTLMEFHIQNANSSITLESKGFISIFMANDNTIHTKCIEEEFELKKAELNDQSTLIAGTIETECILTEAGFEVIKMDAINDTTGALKKLAINRKVGEQIKQLSFKLAQKNFPRLNT